MNGFKAICSANFNLLASIFTNKIVTNNVGAIRTWPVPIQRRGVVVSVDGARGVAVYFTVHWQVAVAGNCDPLRSVNRVVIDRLRVRI